MLMSVLKGELAIQQSISLIRIFRAMKDYMSEDMKTHMRELIEKMKENPVLVLR